MLGPNMKFEVLSFEPRHTALTNRLPLGGKIEAQLMHVSSLNYLIVMQSLHLK